MSACRVAKGRPLLKVLSYLWPGGGRPADYQRAGMGKVVQRYMKVVQVSSHAQAVPANRQGGNHESAGGSHSGQNQCSPDLLQVVSARGHSSQSCTCVWLCWLKGGLQATGLFSCQARQADMPSMP